MARIQEVTELDFEAIKNNLKVYLAGQDKFSDYDFDGSGINILLDILAYNTQYNALLAHMNINESFLDSAQLRQNVVSIAKTLNYSPASRKASEGVLSVAVTGNANSAASITIPKGMIFSALVGDVTYQFVTNDSYSATKDGSNNYSFSNVYVYEGTLKTNSFRAENSIENQKFIITDPNIDKTTMTVQVKESLTSTSYESYTLSNNILEVTATSKVFFVTENNVGQYEVSFGDGILGKKPESGNIIEITYISTSGEAGNGATTFTTSASIGGLTGITVSRETGFDRTSTGAEKESVASIKYNAPRAFTAQNRAVTAEDYKTLLLDQYDFIEDLSIWGGEQNDPPVYGKVYISIKPIGADFLSQLTKQGIETFLRSKNVGSVTTETVNPDYTYLTLKVFFKYDSRNTSKSQGQLEAAVTNTIRNYDSNILSKFDGVFRSSNLLSQIDDTDPGILNSVIRMSMHKHLTPNSGVATKYELNFAGNLYITEDESIITSNAFTVAGQSVKLADSPTNDGTGNHTIRLINPNTQNTISGYENIGTIYPSQGKVVIDSLNITSTDELLIIADPDSNDIAPKFNQLVRIEFDADEPGLDGVTVTGELDTIAVIGSSAASSYTTISRHD